MGNNQSNDILNICVVGLVNSGKTTLINKIIGNVPQDNYHPTNVNIMISNNSMDESELITNNIIVSDNITNINNAIKNMNYYAVDNMYNGQKLIALKTPLKLLYYINSDSTIFYDTCGLELTESNKGKNVLEITKKCNVILYVLKFNGLAKLNPVVFKHYKLFKKYNKKVYIIVTHIDLYNIPNMNIKNSILQNYLAGGINIEPDEIILFNLLEHTNHNFISYINKIILKSKMDFGKINVSTVQKMKVYNNNNYYSKHEYTQQYIENIERENITLKKEIEQLQTKLNQRNINDFLDIKINDNYNKCFRCNDTYVKPTKNIVCEHKDICIYCTQFLTECVKCGTKYE